MLGSPDIHSGQPKSSSVVPEMGNSFLATLECEMGSMLSHFARLHERVKHEIKKDSTASQGSLSDASQMNYSSRAAILQVKLEQAKRASMRNQANSKEFSTSGVGCRDSHILPPVETGPLLHDDAKHSDKFPRSSFNLGVPLEDSDKDVEHRYDVEKQRAAALGGISDESQKSTLQAKAALGGTSDESPRSPLHAKSTIQHSVLTPQSDLQDAQHVRPDTRSVDSHAFQSHNAGSPMVLGERSQEKNHSLSSALNGSGQASARVSTSSNSAGKSTHRLSAASRRSVSTTNSGASSVFSVPYNLSMRFRNASILSGASTPKSISKIFPTGMLNRNKVKRQSPKCLRQQSAEVSESIEPSLEEETVFSVDPVWAKKKMMKKMTTNHKLRFNHSQTLPEADMSGVESWLAQHVTVQPQSTIRLCWDICTVLLVLYDAVVIPLQLLDLPEMQLDIVMNYFMVGFWSLDMIASLLTGFTRKDGSIELEPKSIALRYSRTWLVPDVMIVGAAWMETFGSGSMGMLQWLRVVKFLRLARLARIQAVLSTFVERVSSEMLSLCISSVCCVLAIVGVNHVVACLWVGLGKHEADGWITREELRGDALMQYAIAYHWAFTQCTGSMELAPGNFSERLFAICALMSGFLMATLFVSTVTSLTTRLYMISNERTKKLKSLNRHLNDNKVSMRVASRVLQNAKHVLYKQNQNIAEEDVALLKMISEPLRVEIHFEMHGPTLSHHAFMRVMAMECQSLVRQICHNAISTRTSMRDDVVFSAGEVPITPAMIFVARGEFRYVQDMASEEYVIVGDWACEPTLWSECWMHQGNLGAKSDGMLAFVDARNFREIVGSGGSSDPFYEHIASYAVAFVNALNANVDSLSDIGRPKDALELTCGLDFETQLPPRKAHLQKDDDDRSEHRGFDNIALP